MALLVIRFMYLTSLIVQGMVAFSHSVKFLGTQQVEHSEYSIELVLLLTGGVLTVFALLLTLMQKRQWLVVSVASSLLLLALSASFPYRVGTPLMPLLFAMWLRSTETSRCISKK